MIESPLIQEIVAEARHKDILRILTKRLGAVPLEIKTALQTVREDSQLDEVVDWALTCPDLDTFRSRLPA